MVREQPASRATSSIVVLRGPKRRKRRRDAPRMASRVLSFTNAAELAWGEDFLLMEEQINI